MKVRRLKIMRKDAIFVFGSNESGLHGAGAARFALNHKGATMGLAFGLSGQSFAIPTKDKTLKYTLSLDEIKRYVDSFIWQVRGNGPDAITLVSNDFQVTRIGCGLAGLNDEDVAPLFKEAPENCWFDEAWRSYLGTEGRRYWGTK